jgi:hypothetical protein
MLYNKVKKCQTEILLLNAPFAGLFLHQPPVKNMAVKKKLIIIVNDAKKQGDKNGF